MSIKPIDIMMSITQSQTIKLPDADQNIKHNQQEQIIINQNQKTKESVIKIPDEENITESMDIIKHGMPDSNNNSAFDFHHQKKEDEENNCVPNKALLDDDNGHAIDIIG